MSRLNVKRVQIIWWGWDWRLGFGYWEPELQCGFRWIAIGPLEVRVRKREEKR